MTTIDHRSQLQQQLWNIADTLRGKMNADEFRDYILGFIFYKYLSERMTLFGDEVCQADGLRYAELNDQHPQYEEIIQAVRIAALGNPQDPQNTGDIGFFLEPQQLFAQIAKRGQGPRGNNLIVEELQTIFRVIEENTLGTQSEEDFGNLFEDLDLNSTKLGKNPQERNDLIVKILLHLDKIDFKLKQTEIDVLGDAYEYLIGKFASDAGKKAGEFYTPQEVSTVLARLVTLNRPNITSVYDPTCGSGSLLIRVGKCAKVLSYYGQEMNRTTYNLARMNMILHDIKSTNFDIKQDDTLENPMHRDKTFEVIVANPPFSAKWSANPIFNSDDRFSSYGKLAPSSKADFAFVQHMIHHLDEKGIMAVVLPHGALFRGGAEQHIRTHLIQTKNYLDAVIGLPPNIFYGTTIPTCILVFKKCRENPKNIIFIDASKEFEKAKTQNLLTETHINTIITTYQERNNRPQYSQVVSLEQIAQNDFNLNIPRYVDTFEAETPINLETISQELQNLQNQTLSINQTLAQYCQELGIKTPF